MNAVLPDLSVLFAVLATAVPWGLPADATFILPLVVVMMVFCWRTFPDAVLHPAVAMLLGLLTDIMSGGPARLFRSACADRRDRRRMGAGAKRGTPHAALWLFWIVFVALLAGFGWLLASLYFMRWIDWWPIVFGALASIALFPVVLRGVVWIRHGNRFRALIFRGRT